MVSTAIELHAAETKTAMRVRNSDDCGLDDDFYFVGAVHCNGMYAVLHHSCVRDALRRPTLLQARWITIVCERYKLFSRMAVRENCADVADVKEQTSAAALDTQDVAAQPLAQELHPSRYNVDEGMLSSFLALVLLLVVLKITTDVTLSV